MFMMHRITTDTDDLIIIAPPSTKKGRGKPPRWNKQLPTLGPTTSPTPKNVSTRANTVATDLGKCSATRLKDQKLGQLFQLQERLKKLQVRTPQILNHKKKHQLLYLQLQPGRMEPEEKRTFHCKNALNSS